MADTLFFSPDLLSTMQLPEQESQHCVKALRMREGDKITVTDGRGTIYNCTIIQAHPKHCFLDIISQTEPTKTRDFNLHIAFAPVKSIDRNEWFVEKATEIGVDRFVPMLCRFSERKEVKSERLRKIAIAAMKQSQQALLPEIDEMTPFDKLVTTPFDGQKFIAHCYDTPRRHLTECCRKGRDTLVLIGPEGDFDESEIQKAIDNGFEPITLGNTRLRTETACFVACHTIHVINAATQQQQWLP